MDSSTRRRVGPMRWVATVAFLSIALAPAASVADDNNASSMAQGIGIGSASAISSLIYGPVKICYALGGVVVGGLAWAFSGGDAEVAKTVITPAVYGDYVIAPAVLRGQQPLEFYGRAPGYSAGNVSAAGPDDW